jgi:hypothetical protein
VVQAAANTQRIQERAVADLWLNMYVGGVSLFAGKLWLDACAHAEPLFALLFKCSTAPIANPAVFLPPAICSSSNEVVSRLMRAPVLTLGIAKASGR